MRICIAGSRGHLNYVFDGLSGPPRLPGSSGHRVVGIQAADAAELAVLRRLCAGIDPAGAAVPAEYRDWDEALDRERPDIAVVCGPFEERAAMCAAAFERGIHVFCEKTVALNLEDLAVLRVAWRRSGVHFAAMMGLRCDPAFFTARALVAEGRIGELRLINAQKSYKLGARPAFYHDRASYGGTIPWVGSHAVDWIRWFADAPFRSVSARHSARANGGNGNLEASALCQFELEGEVLASASVDFLRPASSGSHGDDRIRVVGAAGIVEVRGGEVFLTEADAGGERKVPASCGRGIFEDFVAGIAGASITGLDGEATLAVTEACLLARKSADERREILFNGTL